MAILASKGGGDIRSYEISTICPEGVYPAVCLDIFDSPGIEEPSFDDPSIMVLKDKTRFLFLVKAGEKEAMVQTFEFNVSGSPKSKLYDFIKNWLGKPPPAAFDTINLIGKPCQITIENRVSKKGTPYASVSGIAPLMDPTTAPSTDGVEIPGGPRAELPDGPQANVDENSSSEGNGDGAKDPFVD